MNCLTHRTNHIAMVDKESHLHLVSMKHHNHSAVYELPSYVRVIALHPQEPVLFATTPVVGELMVLLVNNSINNSNSFKVLEATTHIRISHSKIIQCCVDRSSVIVHSA